jgi:hypothetical protein
VYNDCPSAVDTTFSKPLLMDAHGGRFDSRDAGGGPSCGAGSSRDGAGSTGV